MNALLYPMTFALYWQGHASSHATSSPAHVALQVFEYVCPSVPHTGENISGHIQLGSVVVLQGHSPLHATSPPPHVAAQAFE